MSSLNPVVVGALQNVIRGVAVDAVADADLHVLAHVDDAHLIEAVTGMTTIVDDEARRRSLARCARSPGARQPPRVRLKRERSAGGRRTGRPAFDLLEDTEDDHRAI
jgi:hypothetical protein